MLDGSTMVLLVRQHTPIECVEDRVGASIVVGGDVAENLAGQSDLITKVCEMSACGGFGGLAVKLRQNLSEGISTNQSGNQDAAHR